MWCTPNQLIFSSIDPGQPVRSLPIPDVDDDARNRPLDQLSLICLAISNEWRLRAEATLEPNSPGHVDDGQANQISGADRWAEQTCYAFICQWLRVNDPVDIIALCIERARSNGRYRRGRTLSASSEQIFQAGLMAIFSHLPDQKEPKRPRDGNFPKTPRRRVAPYSSAQRQTLGREMWHAYRHYVPPPFLRGFIKQAQTIGTRRGWRNSAAEPGFEEWVTFGSAMQLLAGEQDHRTFAPHYDDDAVHKLAKQIKKAGKRTRI
jgi:hypothetical protein